MAWYEKGHRAGRTSVEPLLILIAVPVLAAVLVLAFFARWRLDTPSDAVMINQASPDQFALALDIDISLAKRLVSDREMAGGFGSVDSLRYLKLFPPREAEKDAEILTESRINWKTAGADQFAADLNLSSGTAARLIEGRDALLTGLSPEAAASLAPEKLLERIPLLDNQKTRPYLSRLLVRRPAEVFWRYLFSSVFLLSSLMFLPPYLRNRLHVKGDPYLPPVAILLSGMGTALLFTLRDPLRQSELYWHQTIGAALGLGVMLFFSRLNLKARLQLKRYQYLWALGAGALMALLLLFGHGPGGVRLALFGFQPVELSRLMILLFLAAYLSDRSDQIADSSSNGRRSAFFTIPRRQDIAPVLVLFGFTLLFFYIIKDMGPGLLLFSAFICLLYLTTGRGVFLWVGLILVLFGGWLGYLFHAGFFAVRVDMWLHPWRNLHPQGMQLGQALWGMGTGGWSGSGLGLGLPAAIPRAEDDMAFAAWSEQTGLAGSLILLLLFSILIWRGAKIAIRASNPFDRALAFGITSLMAVQVLLILGGVTGLLPLTGLSLPFFCYGNSALISGFIMLGLLLGISSHSEQKEVIAMEVKPEIQLAARRFTASITILLIGVVGVGRLGQIELLEANEIAVRPIFTPDQDGVLRPHYNPRLLSIAGAIPRGSIYDRNGHILATSKPTEILQLISNRTHAASLISSHSRWYPYGAVTANVIGVSNPLIGGPSGLEALYNKNLRGYNRLADLLGDYRSRFLPGYSPRKGSDLHLSLNAKLQGDALHALELIASHGKSKLPTRGAFVMINPSNGHVLAEVSLPTFNPNTLTPQKYYQLLHGAGLDAPRPLINRAVDGYYPPGSTLKAATAACALDHLPDALRIGVECNHVGVVRWRVGGKTYSRRIHDDPGDPDFGRIYLPEAFRVSSNIYFATLASILGPNILHNCLSQTMGFARTPPLSDFNADAADIGFGQGRMTASPLEMARLAAAVANDGRMMQTQLVTTIVSPNAVNHSVTHSPVEQSQAMSVQTSYELRILMRSVVTNGTASGVFGSLVIPVAGKTGTAQTGKPGLPPHSWFIGIAPCDGSAQMTPHYAFACIVENGGYGRSAAAVVCLQALQSLY